MVVVGVVLAVVLDMVIVFMIGMLIMVAVVITLLAVPLAATVIMIMTHHQRSLRMIFSTAPSRFVAFLSRYVCRSCRSTTFTITPRGHAVNVEEIAALRHAGSSLGVLTLFGRSRDSGSNSKREGEAVKALWIWVLMTGPVNPQGGVGTHFGGAYLRELDCRRAASELTLQFNAPAGEYWCMHQQVITCGVMKDGKCD